MINNKLDYYKAKLSDEVFFRISDFIEGNYGIRLPRQKKAMVQNRLYKRLIELEIPSFDEYIRFVFSTKGNSEVQKMVDEITTNKTDFFRESKHFDFFKENIIKQNESLRIWSAGCSTGEEAYSLAMILEESNNLSYSILATDLSTKVIEAAKNGIYQELVVKPIQENILNKYFTEEITDDKKFYKAKQQIRQFVKFGTLNFMDSNYNIPYNFDVIFFRNVLIYFNMTTQLEILKKIISHLKVGGHLFIGHSEAIYDFSMPIKSVNPSVYIKTS
ncbi:MAG: hypothetical protein JXL97_02265 [Bacteroidales bacterium]|nr:hypothetical protein [Bacteroidales bacterium]